MLGLALTLTAALPVVGLNHFYVVLDAATYDAIVSSDFVTEELAAVDAGLTHPLKPQPGSPSLYLRGRDTYIELMSPRNRSGLPVGSCGLALSPDGAGALDKLEGALKRAGQHTHRRVVTLDAGEHPIPWYDSLGIEGQDETRLSWWVSQYHPQFVTQVLHTDRVDRRSYLAHLYRPDRLFENVVEISLALTADESNRLRAQLRALGFREKPSSSGRLLEDGGLQLRIVPQRQVTSPTIVSATLSLARPLTRSLALGSTQFVAQGQRAVWRFAPAVDAQSH